MSTIESGLESPGVDVKYSAKKYADPIFSTVDPGLKNSVYKYLYEHPAAF